MKPNWFVNLKKKHGFRKKINFNNTPIEKVNICPCQNSNHEIVILN